eukprot:8322279-Pyramimonas_sp.AAC.1
MRHGANENLRRQLAEAHRVTFFRVRWSPQCAHSHAGSRPGNGLADLLFNISFAEALGPLQMDLGERGFLLEPPAPTEGHAHLTRPREDDVDEHLPE